MSGKYIRFIFLGILSFLMISVSSVNAALQLEQNNQELVDTVKISYGSTNPYLKTVVLSIRIDNIMNDEILYVTSELAATNDRSYTAGFFSTLILADSPSQTVIDSNHPEDVISPANGYNLYTNVQHGIRTKNGMYKATAQYTTKYINLVVYSMAADENSYDQGNLKIERGYGKISVLRIK